MTSERGGRRSGPSTIARSVGKQAVRFSAMTTARWRTTPTFLLIGAKRGGTTTLYRQLETHPAYVPLVPSARRFPMRENMKGVHYFDSHHRYGDRWYRSHFPLDATCSRHARRHGAAFTGDGSPYHLFHPLAAERAAGAVPNAFVIAVLRDPIERTISHWAEQTRNGVETLPLDEALHREAERVGDDDARLADERIRYSFAHEQQSYAAQSEYAAGLDRWLTHFPRRRTLLLFSEDLYRDPASTLATVADFMGLPAFPTVDAMQRNAAPRPAALDDHIGPELRARLVERFTPTAERVAELVGRTPPWPWFAEQSTAADAMVDR